MQQYHDLLRYLLDHGTNKSDRTGTGTASVFGYQMRFDLEAGFPLITTKKLHLKSIVHELLWFLSGSTDVRDLQKHGVKIWDEWATAEQCAKFGREAGDLGPVYGKLWRAWPSNQIVKVEPRVLEKESPLSYPLRPIETPDAKKRTNDIVGNVFESKSFGELVVLRGYRVAEVKDRDVYDVQFLRTGFVKKGVRHSQLRKNTQIRDRYAPAICGVACLGDAPEILDKMDQILYQRWFAMIRRCYDTEHVGYASYGARGVFVCNRWLMFSNFREDVKKLSGWFDFVSNPKEFELDKDYYGSNAYSPDTCVWLSQAENTVMQGVPVRVIFPTGKKEIALSRNSAARKTGVSPPTVSAAMTSGRSVRGFKFELLSDGLYRKQLPIDQIARVVETLKSDPDSRRHVVSAWQPANRDFVTLESCHALFQFYVAEGRLSCQLYQRSADVFLGVPFNIASYSLLTAMIAQVVGLRCGEFVHTLGDAHLYRNHFDQARLQLERELRPLPRLKLDPSVNRIDDFRYEHIEVEGYDPHPHIPAPVAV